MSAGNAVTVRVDYSGAGIGRFLFLGATLSVIAVNAAAILLPINGVSTEELSARYPTGFTPAGWVFSIWSVIYVGLLALSVWSAMAPRSTRLSSIRGPYLVSCAANGTWIFLWHYEQVLASVLVMLVLLGSLATLYVRLRRGPAGSPLEWLCVDLPISVYLGWITTASIANFATWLFDVGAYPLGLGMDAWALVSVTLAIAVYVGVGVLTRDAVYVGVFAWASLGIAYQTLPTSEPVRVVAAAGCVIAASLAAVLLVARVWPTRAGDGANSRREVTR